MTKLPNLTQEPTCADEHDVIEGAIQGLGPVYHYLGVVYIFFDQLGPVVYRGHRVIHQRVVFYKLQRFVWEIQGAGVVGCPSLTVDTLQGKSTVVTCPLGFNRAQKSGPGHRATVTLLQRVTGAKVASPETKLCFESIESIVIGRNCLRIQRRN